MVASSANEIRNLPGVFSGSWKMVLFRCKTTLIPSVLDTFHIDFPVTNNKQLHEMCKSISLKRCSEYCFIIVKITFCISSTQDQYREIVK